MASFRQLPSGKWQAEIRLKAFPPQRKSHRTKSQARAWAQAIEDSMRMGEFSQADALLLSDLFTRYMREIVPLKKTTQYHKSNIKNLRASLGHIPATQLTSADVVDYVGMRRKSVKSATVRKEINTLNHVIKSGIALWGVGLASNPVAVAKDILSVTKALTDSKPRNRRLEDGEESALMLALQDSPETQLIAMLTLDTARRLKELLAIDGEVLSVRNKRWFLRVVDSKTDRPLNVPLSDYAANLLDGFSGFTMRPDSYSQAFSRAVKRAGIEGLRLTDLRHEALSRLFERGFSVPEVMSISGHSSPDVLLKVYAQVSADKLQTRLSNGPDS